MMSFGDMTPVCRPTRMSKTTKSSVQSVSRTRRERDRYRIQIKSRGMRWVGHVARMGETRGVYRVLVGKTEGK